MTPFVRHMLICNRVLFDPTRPEQVGIEGLLSIIRPKFDQVYPLVREFSIYVMMSSVRSPGTLKITVTEADTSKQIYSTIDIPVKACPNPLEITGSYFEITRCVFPAPGLYWVDLWYYDEMIAQQPIEARERK